jgi:hypothetical protein
MRRFHAKAATAGAPGKGGRKESAACGISTGGWGIHSTEDIGVSLGKLEAGSQLADDM